MDEDQPEPLSVSLNPLRTAGYLLAVFSSIRPFGTVVKEALGSDLKKISPSHEKISAVFEKISASHEKISAPRKKISAPRKKISAVFCIFAG
ncbi:MAG: hypothetical protein IJ570_07855 [Prevotella sp.]|nr:hypothetical protein [Prevotella sp.]